MAFVNRYITAISQYTRTRDEAARQTHLYTILFFLQRTVIANPRGPLQLPVFRRPMRAGRLMKEEKSLWLKYVGLRSAIRRQNSRWFMGTY